MKDGELGALGDGRLAFDVTDFQRPQITAGRPGDTTIVVAYRGQITTVRVLIPVVQPADFHYPELPEVNYIDREVFAKLGRLNVVPSVGFMPLWNMW